MPLTTEQKKLYLDLENAIEKKEDITDLLKQVEKNDLIEVFATCGTKVKYINSGKKEDTESMNLIEYAAGIGNMEGLKAIFNYCKKNSISVANLLKSLKSDVDLSSSAELREIQFDEREIFLKILNGLKEVGSLKEFLSAKEESPIFKSLPTAHYESIFECLNESEDDKIDVGLLVNKLSDKGILKEVISIMKGDLLEIEKLKNELKCSNNYDALGKIYRAEKEIAANKAMKVGSVCGVIAALAVGGGCFAAGVALPILAIIGIAVAAAVLTGLIAGGITYVMSKPSNELNGVDAQPKVCPEAEVAV